ncbi:hypothetical protein D3C85_1905820 [compost metagenome]
MALKIIRTLIKPRAVRTVPIFGYILIDPVQIKTNRLLIQLGMLLPQPMHKRISKQLFQLAVRLIR